MSLTKKEQFARNFAANLKREREHKGLTQEQVAKSAKMATKQFGHYEAGVNLPNLHRFSDICRALGCRPEKLIG